MINSILLVAYFNHSQEVWERNKGAFFFVLWVYSLFFFMNKKSNVWGKHSEYCFLKEIEVFL